MRSEWEKTIWGEIATLEYGKAIRGYQYAAGDFPVYGTNGQIGWHTVPLYSSPGVIIGRKGAYRGVHYSLKPFFVIDTAFYLKPKEKLDAKWAYYCLLTYNINGMDSGSAIPSTSREEFYKLPVCVPTYEEQLRTADFLSALDDRITLLRETNATLEAMAQALFKSWFVDFDPVRAKQQGRVPEGMDEATAALFPDSFEPSELGEIPKGWRIGILNDLAVPHKGSIDPLKNPDTLFEYYSLPAFDNQKMPLFELGKQIKSNKTLVPHNAVLLSKLNPHIPRIWLPNDAVQEALCSTEFLVFLPSLYASKEFLYCVFTTANFLEKLCQLVTGTSNSHQRVKPANVLSINTIIPTPEALSAFNNLVQPIFDRIGRSRQQAQTLANLRDTLLPRLISGQLRIEDTENLTAQQGVA